MILYAMSYESPFWLTFKQAKEMGGIYGYFARTVLEKPASDRKGRGAHLNQIAEMHKTIENCDRSRS